MLATNLKIIAVVLGTIGLYTLVATSIPQVQSAVPEEVEIGENMSAEELAAVGEELYAGVGGCTACHGTGTRAPNLLADDGGTGLIGERCTERVSGMGCKEYLHESLVDPNTFVVEGFQPIMPDMSRTLSPGEVWALVAYLEAQGGEVTVGAEELAAAAQAAEAGASGGGDAAATADVPLEPMEIMAQNQCLACHEIGGQGAPIGPPLDEIGAQYDADYIRRSILEPNADTAQGYEAVAGTMPPTLADQLTPAQLEVLVWYLASRR